MEVDNNESIDQVDSEELSSQPDVEEHQQSEEGEVDIEEEKIKENTGSSVSFVSFSVTSEDAPNEECNNSQDDQQPQENVKVEQNQEEQEQAQEQKQVEPEVVPAPATQSPAPASPTAQSAAATSSQPVVSSINLSHNAKLIQVTGKKDPYYYIPVPLSPDSLNTSDAFIMQSDSYMFVWATDKTHSQKKAKAIQMAQKLKVEIGCQRAVQVLEVGEEHPTFNWCLGVPKGTKLVVSKDSSDLLLDEDGLEREPEYFLYRVGKVEGKLNVIPIEEEVITQEMFVSTSCFIFDCEHEIHVWQGEKSNREEKEVSMTLAKRFLTMFERPANTAITPEYDGSEGCIFRSKFSVWKEKEGKPLQSYLNLGKKKEALSFNVKDMHQDKEVPEIHLGSKDSKGKLLVWSYVKSQWQKVEEDDFGIFYSNRSYVINFIYKPDGKNSIKSAIFYWEGSYSNNRAYISYKFGLYKEIQKKMQSLQADDPIEYRIAQGREPYEFIQLFGNETIVLNEELSLTRSMMFQIRGEEGNVRGTQLSEISAARLNSLDSFCIIIPKKCILVWYGRASNEAERTLAADLFTFLPPEYESGVREIEEGEEPESFWKIIGGKQEYPEYEEKPKKNKLFMCTESTGIFKAEEVKPFAQVDLNREENFILDRFNSLYVWRGSKTTDAKFDMTMKVAQEYLEAAEDERPADLQIQVEQDGEESSVFRSSFISWKIVKAKTFVDPREAYTQKLAAEAEQKKLEEQQAAAAAALMSEVSPSNPAAEVKKEVKEDVKEVKEDIVEQVEVKEEIVEQVEVKEEVKEVVEQVGEDDVSVTPPSIITTPPVESPASSETTPVLSGKPPLHPKSGSYNNNDITVSENGDLLFAYEAFNVLTSPKSATKKGKKKKNRNRSLSQNSTPVSPTPISRSCELPPPPFNFEAGQSSSSSNNNNNNNNSGSPLLGRKKAKQHNRTGSHGSPHRVGITNSNNNNPNFSPKIKSTLNDSTN